LKVVILHNDFRVFWRGRLSYLQTFLGSKGISFYAVELFGEGSPYTFDIYEDTDGSWHTCLFPHNSSEDIAKKEIEKALLTELDRLNADIIIGPSIVFYAGALGLRWAKKNKRKFIMFDDARHLQVKRNFLVQWIKDKLIKQADGLWFPSEDYKKDYAYFHRKGIYFFYGYNCVDNQLFKFDGEKKLDNNVIVCVARLVPIKNIDNLLKAWQLVEQKNSDYKLVIIGDGPLYQDLIKLKGDLNLKKASFVGAVANGDIPAHFSQADALILASLSETWGLVVNEAMAGGLPLLLSSNINANQALLAEAENGFSFNPFDINGMSEAILSFIGLRIEIKRKMSACSSTMIDSMSYERMGAQLIDALMVIDKKKIRRPGPIAFALLNLWAGQYNKTGWYK